MAIKISRTQAREQAFIVLFEQLFHNDFDIEELISDAEISLETNFSEYAVFLIKNIALQTKSIDDLFQKHLKSWSIERISKTSLIVLRIAVYEFFFCESVPENVAISEAVILIKKYSDEKDASFVNGVLSSISKEYDISKK
ncbi:MAG: transcription antitermination factor NusB [Oscillospiraceae bacterium]